MKEFSPFAMEVAACDDQGLEERDGAEVVDLHVARHGEDVERAVELAHGFVEKGCYEAAVQISGWAFVVAIELDVRRCRGALWIVRACREGEMESLWIGGAAAEAVAGTLVDGGIAGHGVGHVTGFIG